MKALVKENMVVQVDDKEFPVHPDLQWVNCDETVKPGCRYENGVFTPCTPQAIEVIPLSHLKMEALWDSIANNDNTKLNALKAQMGV